MAAHWRNEGMLGPPETNRAAYEYASNLRLASELKGSLLLIHGTRDTDVPISHTMRMVVAPVYVLMDGGSFSAGSAFCATAAFYKRATFIGEETGGVGGGAGGSIRVTLSESQLSITIPQEAEFSVMDPGSLRRGTIPTRLRRVSPISQEAATRPSNSPAS